MPDFIRYASEYFDPSMTLCCGQTFRYGRQDDGWMTMAADHITFLHKENDMTVIEADDLTWAADYFDLSTDYAEITERAADYRIPALTLAVEFGKGIRILRQDPSEMLFSFLISQNNNIPRIQNSIRLLCDASGFLCSFRGTEYRAFPAATDIRRLSVEGIRRCGTGYRDKYIKKAAEIIAETGMHGLLSLSTPELRERLLCFPGIGEKVADCILLFGFHRTDCFPVDTWIEKVYRENFGGQLTDRRKIAAWFSSLFGRDSGYFQQYLFHAKRMKQI